MAAIDMISVPSPVLGVTQAQTLTITPAQAQARCIVHNFGASGESTVYLPSAMPGMRVDVICAAAQIITLTPVAGEYMIVPSTGVAKPVSSALASSASAANKVSLICTSRGIWNAATYLGTWA